MQCSYGAIIISTNLKGSNSKQVGSHLYKYVNLIHIPHTDTHTILIHFFNNPSKSKLWKHNFIIQNWKPIKEIERYLSLCEASNRLYLSFSGTKIHFKSKFEQNPQFFSWKNSPLKRKIIGSNAHSKRSFVWVLLGALFKRK